jgi:hypothetical protein
VVFLRKHFDRCSCCKLFRMRSPHLRIQSVLMRTRALATVRVSKKRLKLQAQSRTIFRGGCGLPVATVIRS